MKKIIVLLIILAASSVSAKNYDTGYEPEGLDELKKMKKSVFTTVLVRPEVDFSRYERIQPQTVALVIRDPSSVNQFSTGRLISKRENENVIPEYQEVVEFQQIVGTIIAESLSEELDLEVVDTAGPGTLILKPVVTDVEIDSSSRNTAEDGRELPQLDEGVIVFDLMDGETGEILARFAENRRNRPPKAERKSEGVWPNLAYWAESVAADLCAEFSKLKGGGPAA
jgi:hypothetical protein